MGRKPHPRKQEALEKLRRGATYKAVATDLGITYETAWRWASDAGIAVKRDILPGPRRIAAEPLLRAGDLTDADIARRFGVSRARVGQWRTDLGLPRSDPREPRREEARRLLTAGMDVHAVSATVGMSASAVDYWRRSLGIASPPRVVTEDLIGRAFGRWTVIEKGRPGPNTYWRCRCQCGQTRDVQAAHLRTGRSRSCGAAGCLVHQCSICHQSGHSRLNCPEAS